ncbi:uroporphyrinogen decarboxylase [Thermogutta sp.]|jgi:uroporphyrinogen decarboxylase|uniref:uroporphyrinogen decarboxylase n=1 Tax=Thermogutta sp. TaxID=1962930 RepID=UPI0032209B42
MPALPWEQSSFMKAARREPVERVPIWLMRQAGRYLPEYRQLREKVSFLELCRSPELAAEITVSTVARLGVDAAILFADLLPILEPMGFDLRFGPDEGPVIRNPLRDPRDVERVREFQDADLNALDFVFQAVRLARANLPAEIPLIGFAGAPFTLAAYAIEGRTSRSFERTKRFLFAYPQAWQELMDRLVPSVGWYLKGQVDAGVQAIQLFDSWAGCLSPEHYRQFVLPYTQAVLGYLPQHVPVIYFLTGNPALIPLQAEVGGQVIGVDWRVDIADAWAAVGEDHAIQGNLDPAVLCASREFVLEEARRILEKTRGRPGHIFNLGHGVLPSTPVENVLALVDFVHAWDPQQLPQS